MELRGSISVRWAALCSRVTELTFVQRPEGSTGVSRADKGAQVTQRPWRGGGGAWSTPASQEQGKQELKAETGSLFRVRSKIPEGSEKWQNLTSIPKDPSRCPGGQSEGLLSDTCFCPCNKLRDC